VRKGDPLFSIDDRAIRAALVTQEAAVMVAESQFAQAKYESDIGETLVQTHVLSREDGMLRRYLAETASAQLTLARAQLSATKIDIERQTVLAPLDGEIMQMKIHPGEFAQTGTVTPPLILMGNNEPFHVRVDVDENEAWRVQHAASAVGYLRGNTKIMAHLRFVRFEPYVVPKISLSGAATERVDTRVLQVIYSIEAGQIPIKPGQQMDVYIQATQFPQ
jgi:multidrug resistance efflux pump